MADDKICKQHCSTVCALDESKMDREHDVVVVRLQERMSLRLWLCLLYAAIPNPIPNPRSEPLVPQSPPSHCSSNASEPIPFTPPQMVTSASPRQSLSCLIVISILPFSLSFCHVPLLISRQLRSVSWVKVLKSLCAVFSFCLGSV